MATALAVDPDRGLAPEEAARRLTRHGANRLRTVAPPGALALLARQVKSPIVGLLAVAALLSFLLGESLDGAAIALVLALNTAIGFVTELRAVRSMEALRSLGAVRARVRRGGVEQEVDAAGIVPGDVALLEAGDVVTADVRLVRASKLEADESTLTGESLPVAKDPAPVPDAAPLAERASLLFKGTSLTRGSAEGVVVATGMETELGRIAQLVQEAEDEATPLEERLASLGRRLLVAVLVVALVTTLLGVLGGRPWLLMVQTGIALAVAAIPEGMPVVATMALARGMWRMARRNALINRLSAVETLGATAVILTDKTGTLTENRMSVRRLALPDGDVDVRTGEPEPFRDAAGGAPVDPAARGSLRAALEVAVLCNNATLGGDGRDAQRLGDPMETALLEAGRAAGLERGALLARHPELREEAFDAATRRMATVHADGEGELVALKGAPEAILDAVAAVRGADGAPVPLDPAARSAWARRAEELAAEGLRVLGLARARTARGGPRELLLVGLLGLADPPRSDVADALAACRAAGIRVVMVTGDHAATAASIARSLGLVPRDSVPRVATGAEIAACASDEELLAGEVFARVSPEEKLRLVAAHQAAGHVVAMTGDGVNDAPALHKADIGVAMGRRGTQVAREAADMVLTDDAFPSIVAAVAQGRVLFDNLRKFVLYLLSCNVSEILAVSLAAALGLALPLLPLQLLFLNLVTDVFPALALAFGEAGGDVLSRPPRGAREPIVTRAGWLFVAGYGAVLAAGVLAALVASQRLLGYPPERAVTVSFLALAGAQLVHVLNVRTPGSGPLRNEVTRNPWVLGALLLCAGLLVASVAWPPLVRVLHTRAPDAAGWGLVLAASLVPLLAGELRRLLRSAGGSGRRRRD